jgi:hypothetical protein
MDVFGWMTEADRKFGGDLLVGALADADRD